MAAFVDWVTCRLPLSCEHAVSGGRVLKLDQHGAVEWSVDRSLGLEGSHDAHMMVRTRGDALELSGNPVKWLQGHNLFGSPDLRAMVGLVADDVCTRLGMVPSAEDRARWIAGAVPLQRLDVTRQYRLPAGTVRQWLSVASNAARAGHQRVTPASVYGGDTLYVGKGSRRVSLKAYDKSKELVKRPLPVTIDDVSKHRLLAYVEDVLRVEVTVRTMFLKDVGKSRVCDWAADDLDALVDDRLSRIAILDNVKMTQDQEVELPARLRGVYALWKQGHDLAAVYPRKTFYRHRKALMPYGVDIANVRPHVVEAEEEYPLGAPLRSFITGPGLEPPTWAYGTPLLACAG